MRGVVVEAILARIRRQQHAHVDAEAQEVAHGIGVFALVQSAQGHAAGRGLHLRGIEPRLEKVDESLHRLRVGARLRARRRHEAGAQFAYCGFPHFGIAGQRVERHGIEGRAAGPVGGVVAVVAEFLDETPTSVGLILRRSRRCVQRHG